MMSADKTIALVACGLCFGSVSMAADEQEQQEPEADFLEYLGMWQESDEDWMLLADLQATEQTTDNDERSDPVPEGKESTETNDES